MTHITETAVPTARPTPQSLRRLFHDETSIGPDPFQAFTHQQPPTPQPTDGSASVEQGGRFDAPLEGEYLESPELPAFDPATIRQQKAQPLSIVTIPDDGAPLLSSSTSSATFPPEELQASTPIVRKDFHIQPVPSPRQIKGRMSLENLSSASSSKSQPDVPRKDSFTGRRPGGSVGEGLKGFQFPLVTKSEPANPLTPGRPQAPPLHRLHSAAPTIPSPSEPSPSRQVPTQLSIVLPTRPPMMRQASVAVMEGRAQSQAQALALAQAQDGSSSPTKNLAVPRLGAVGPVIMMRSRSGSRMDADGLGGGIGLRDLLKVRGIPSQ